MKGHEAEIEDRIENENVNTRRYDERDISGLIGRLPIVGNSPNNQLSLLLLLLPEIVKSIIYFLFPSPGSDS